MGPGETINKAPRPPIDEHLSIGTGAEKWGEGERDRLGSYNTRPASSQSDRGLLSTAGRNLLATGKVEIDENHTHTKRKGNTFFVYYFFFSFLFFTERKGGEKKDGLILNAPKDSVNVYGWPVGVVGYRSTI